MRNAVPSKILISGFQFCRLTKHYPTLYTSGFIQLGLGLTCYTDDDLLKGESNHELTENLHIVQPVLYTLLGLRIWNKIILGYSIFLMIRQ